MCGRRWAMILVTILSTSGAGLVAAGSDQVTLPKGTKLCSNMALETAKGVLDPGKVFWRVTSNPRANGTQTVAAFVLETVYDRKSGDTTIMERRYDGDYATWFKPDPEHEGMHLMISPQDGRVEAIVEFCRKKN